MSDPLDSPIAITLPLRRWREIADLLARLPFNQVSGVIIELGAPVQKSQAVRELAAKAEGAPAAASPRVN